MKRTGSIILLSGLPLVRKSSFLRQLDYLACFWRKEGRSVVIGGPATPDPETLRDARALIALGYPDQFPCLYDQSLGRLPCFLWSQFSRIPRRGLPETPTYVPLTDRTITILHSAGCSRIGPVVPHGVDTVLFAPQHQGQRRDSAEALVVGTVANNSLRKRFDLIVRSFALLARDLPRSRLVIKTNRLVSLDGVDLPDLIAREKVGDRVRIIVEELNPRQMADLYNRMDLYLNLSEWEGFCIPVIEALACGLPVVSLPIQGPGEILPYQDTLVPGSSVREEEGAVLYAADPRAVARILLTLAERTELRRSLGRKGRAEAQCRYDMRRITMQWETVIQRM